MASEANAAIIKCPACGQANRVNPGTGDRQAICGACRTPLVLAKPVIVTDANFSEEVAKSTVPVLLDLWAAWCGPCRIIAPVIEELAKDFAGRATVGKLDVDANPMTASRFNVQGIPTLLFIKDGKEVDRIVGVEPKQSIAARLQRIL